MVQALKQYVKGTRLNLGWGTAPLNEGIRDFLFTFHAHDVAVIYIKFQTLSIYTVTQEESQ